MNPLLTLPATLRRMITGLLGLGLALAVHAHTASTAWLQLAADSGNGVTLQVELPLRDLDEALGLDADDSGELTWGELRRREADLNAFALSGLSLSAAGIAVPLQVAGLKVSERLDSPCAVLRFTARPPTGAGPLTLDYRLFFDRDPLHRCLLAGPGLTAVLAPGHTEAVIGPGASAASAADRMGEFIREGVHHIWTGYDHLAFLLVLLLPAVLRPTPEGWREAERLRPVVLGVVRIVTAFTLAHSLTLGLAAFELVKLPARWVEATIAVSIVVAAVLAFRGGRGHAAATEGSRRTWLTAFGFGLVHGFGFAGVLGELGLDRERLAGPLFGFNLGVELGQLACVAAFLPLAYALRGTRLYRRGIWPAATGAVSLVATGWFVERAFDVAFMPF